MYTSYQLAKADQAGRFLEWMISFLDLAGAFSQENRIFFALFLWFTSSLVMRLRVAVILRVQYVDLFVVLVLPSLSILIMHDFDNA